jgi:hypothetical protein
MNKPRTNISRNNLKQNICVFLYLIAILVITTSYFHKFYYHTNDDIYISFRYVENLLAGNGLVFNAGERVEGYTNLLWMLLIAIFMKFNFDPIATVKFWGIMSALGTLFVVYKINGLLYISNNIYDHKEKRLLPIILLASFVPFNVWIYAGMETMFFTFLLTLGIYLLLKAVIFNSKSHYYSAPIVFLLCSLTRPEGMPFFVLISTVVLTLNRDKIKPTDILTYFSAFFIPYGIYFLIRYNYYGYLLPNTYYVRMGTSFKTKVSLWSNGLYYIYKFAIQNGMCLLLPFIFLVKNKKDFIYRSLVIFVFVYVVYIIYVGGDPKLHYRFLVPVLPALVLLTSRGIIDCFEHINNNLLKEAIFNSFVIICCVALFLPSIEDLTYQAIRLKNEIYFLNPTRVFIGKWYRKHLPPDATIAEWATGAIPYYAKLYTYDTYGVNDPYIAHLDITDGAITAHGKSDPAYIIAKKPAVMPYEAEGYTKLPINIPYYPSFIRDDLQIDNSVRDDYYLFFETITHIMKDDSEELIKKYLAVIKELHFKIDEEEFLSYYREFTRYKNKQT